MSHPPDRHAKPLRRIIYAEDESDIRAIARVCLEQIGGFELRLCESGRQLLETIESFRPDLVMLDVMMPDGNGPDTLKSLRQHPQLAQIPVLFITAKSQAREIEQLKDLGAFAVLRKPFDPMTLAADVRNAWIQYQGE